MGTRETFVESHDDDDREIVQTATSGNWSVDLIKHPDIDGVYYCNIQSPQAYFEFELRDLENLTDIIEASENPDTFDTETVIGYLDTMSVYIVPDDEYEGEFFLCGCLPSENDEPCIPVAGINGDEDLIYCFKHIRHYMPIAADGDARG